MKALDRFLQQWRIAKARPYIPSGSRVLDIGCADGVLFDRLEGRITEGVGIDPDLQQSIDRRHYRLIAGRFPEDLPALAPFDVLTMLAVLEHFPPARLPQVAEACARLLKPGGGLVITVPSPSVDTILHLLQGLRLLDGMDVHEHTGFDVRKTPGLFANVGLVLEQEQSFELGLNNLFVFRKPLSGG